MGCVVKLRRRLLDTAPADRHESAIGNLPVVLIPTVVTVIYLLNAPTHTTPYNKYLKKILLIKTSSVGEEKDCCNKMDFVKDFCYYFGVIAFTLFYVAVDSKACGKCVFFCFVCVYESNLP